MQQTLSPRFWLALYTVAAATLIFLYAQTALTQPAPALEIGRPMVVGSPEPGSDHWFGFSVAIDGDQVLIGEPGVPIEESDRMRFAGAAWLYDTFGKVICKFEKDTPEAEDYFGQSVALSAEYALIGSPRDDDDAGSAYLYSRDTCELLKVFRNPDSGAFSRFALPVSISGDNILIGAYGDDTNGPDWGAAYLFNADPSLPSPDDLRARLANPGQGDHRFGWSVAISATHALIGASRDGSAGIEDAGAAYLYEIDSLMPELVKTFRFAEPRALFGHSLALSDDRVLIGTSASGLPGTAHLYSLADFSEVVPPLLGPDSFVGDGFGRVVALAGGLLMVKSYNNPTDYAWTASLFNEVGGDLVLTFTDPEAGSGPSRMAAAMSPRYLVVGSDLSGARDEGTVYIYPLRTP